MGPKFASLFLYAASGNASSGRWRPRRAAWPATPEPGKTSNVDEAAPYMIGMIVYTELPHNHLGDAIQRP